MSLAALLNRPVTIVYRADGDTTDDYGSVTREETPTETVGELQQATSDEQQAHGDLTETVWKLFLPGTTVPPGPDDAVVVDDVSYEVIGEPWQARNPRTGLISHLEAIVRRTS